MIQVVFEAGSGSGGGSYKGKNRKTGTRKSDGPTNITRPRSGLGGLLGIGGNSSGSVSPSIGNYLQNIMSVGGLLSPEGPEQPGILQQLLSQGADKFSKPAPEPQMAEPPVVMRPKPKTDSSVAQGASGLDMLTELATSMLTQPGASYDYESAMQEAAQGIRQAYGAEIAAIRGNNRAARRDTKRARNEIEHLYNGLAKMYGKQSKQAIRQGEKAADRQMGITEENAGFLKDMNSELMGDETQMLQQLNAPELAGELVSPDFDRMAGQIGDITEQGNRAAQYQGNRAASQSRWLDRSKAGARFEGADTSAALESDLLNFLREQRGQIGVLKGNRAKEVAASNASIQGQMAEAQGQEQEQTWDRLMDLMGMTRQIEDTNFDNNLDANQFQWDQKMDKRKLKLSQVQDDREDNFKGYPPEIKNALTVLTDQKDPNDQKAVNALMKLMGTDAWRMGQIPLGNGETTKLTIAEAMSRARAQGRKAGLQGKELNDFIMAAAASVG